MLIKTEVAFSMEKEEDTLGDKAPEHKQEILLDLGQVGGLMPGDDKGKTTVVFLQGMDLMLLRDYKTTKKQWLDTKHRAGIQLDGPVTEVR